MRSRFGSMFVVLVAVISLGAITASGASAHQWLVNGVEASGQEVSMSTGSFGFEEAGKVFSCSSATGKGTVGAAGAGTAAEIKFTGCKAASNSKCLVYTAGQAAGTIVVANLPTKLVERETSGKEKVLADELKETVATKEFARFKFKAEEPNACEGYLELLVKGEVAGQIENAVGGTINLEFPNPELKGNTLNSGGIAFKFRGGVFKEALVGGGKLTAS